MARQSFVAILRTLKEIPWILGMTTLKGTPLTLCLLYFPKAALVTYQPAQKSCL